jgi:hypothetical protein
MKKFDGEEAPASIDIDAPAALFYCEVDFSGEEGGITL